MAGGVESGERRHRLFLAIRLGDGADAAIGAWAKARAGESGNAGISWVSPSLYHVTLHFFGDASGKDAAAIAEGLEPLAGKVPAPALSIRGVDYLPSRRAPRVLCLGLRVEPEGALDMVIGAARRLASAVGAESDSRPWRAHLTLGRFREHRRGTFAPSWGGPPDIGAQRIQPESFDLMESFLSPRGPRYEALRRYPFAAPLGRAAEGAALPPRHPAP
jgi:2'-5' RNA ligase